MSHTESAGARLTLDLWHPNCWAIEATDRTDGGILAHTVQQTAQSPTASVSGVFTAYGATNSAVEDCLDAVRASSHAGEIQELQARIGYKRDGPGTVARQFLLEYDPDELVCPTLLKHGFVHSAPVRIEDGRERWQVSFTGERPKIQPALDAVEVDADADVSVESIVTPDSDTDRSVGGLRTDSLTPAQRRAFEAAREAGYYQWPRGISVRELATEMDISKTTLLEHLRTAESKLLDPE